jgi:hypothetical protein
MRILTVMAIFEFGSVSDLVNVEVKLLLNRESPGHGGCVLIARGRVLSRDDGGAG